MKVNQIMIYLNKLNSSADKTFLWRNLIYIKPEHLNVADYSGVLGEGHQLIEDLLYSGVLMSEEISSLAKQKAKCQKMMK